jgi:basic membrane protein A
MKNRMSVRKRGLALLTAMLLAAGSLPLSGCQVDLKTMRVAFVGDTQSGEFQNASAELWQGISDYAKNHNATASTYTPSDASAASARTAMESAIDDGAEVIVCVGAAMGSAVYDLQQREIHTQFVLFDAVPTDGTGQNAGRIRGNTYCVRFNRGEAGFLAGYAAVEEGYTKLGYLGGSKEEGDVLYGSGFIQGAEYAGEKKGLGSGAVEVMYGYIPSGAIDPSQVSEVNGWFQEGCQLICVSGNGPEFIGPESAEESGGKAITADMNDSQPDSVIASSGINYTQAAESALEKIRAGSLDGGRINVLGISDGGVRMKLADGGFQNFTEEDYQAVAKEISDGTISITDEDVAADPEGHGVTICKIEQK